MFLNLLVSMYAARPTTRVLLGIKENLAKMVKLMVMHQFNLFYFILLYLIVFYCILLHFILLYLILSYYNGIFTLIIKKTKTICVECDNKINWNWKQNPPTISNSHIKTRGRHPRYEVIIGELPITFAGSGTCLFPTLCVHHSVLYKIRLV